MSTNQRLLLSLVTLFAVMPISTNAQNFELRNATTLAKFGPLGIMSIESGDQGAHTKIARDAWSVKIDGSVIRSEDARPTASKTGDREASYIYDISGFHIQVTYTLGAEANFVGKRIWVIRAPKTSFTLEKVIPWDLTVVNTVTSDYVPSTYLPQFGKTIEQSMNSSPAKDFGDFLRFSDNQGALVTVENPYLELMRSGQSVTLGYAPEMKWQLSWGKFASDTAFISTYRLSGHKKPREMIKEWQLAPEQQSNDGMDDAEIKAFTSLVRASLMDPPVDPITVEVGWTLNDYQIDVGTSEGKDEYKRIIDAASSLGIKTLLYAPANSTLADRTKSTDSWSWEYVLWLNLGEKLRSREWLPDRDPIPASISEMIAYAKEKHVGLLAYVYPSVPFSANPHWLVSGDTKKGDHYSYATLASREFQDYLIHNLYEFQKRTGIAGYSFDYTWLNLPGSSSYAQWYGWRRVMESLRRAAPAIVIDGRQSYQQFGPWSWLAGNYPHPTGNDEQPESFKPFPDLHFDRVSADRARFVNYWYRNYQFAPEQIIPGYATHQSERSQDISGDGGQGRKAEMMYTRFRPRDWDYLGFRYSFLSSIATGGWNNVVDMIPARDEQEAKHFSAEDREWIRDWLAWTVKNKEYLLQTRTILKQPALGWVDGTAAIKDDRGYLFLFNPNYKESEARISLDSTIGLTAGDRYLLREVYPQRGRLLGKPGSGIWSRGDLVQIALDGTSATVLELVPESQIDHPVVFNSDVLQREIPSVATLKGNNLVITHVAGEPGTGTNIGALLPSSASISSMTVNGTPVHFKQTGRYIEAELKFAGLRFAQAQEITFSRNRDGLLSGTFVIPQRIFDQLAARKKLWPIPWTKEDYESTWLASERLLLFFQFANGSDAIPVSAKLDGQAMEIRAAYSSGRVNPPCFVGFYSDLSKIAPDKQHTIELSLPSGSLDVLQGVFFDNVIPELTESLDPTDRVTKVEFR